MNFLIFPLLAILAIYSNSGLAAGPPSVQALQKFIESRLSQENPIFYANGARRGMGDSAGENRFCGQSFHLQQFVSFPENCVLKKTVVGEKIIYRAGDHHCYTSRRSGVEHCDCTGSFEVKSRHIQTDIVNLASIAGDFIEQGDYRYYFTNNDLLKVSRNVTLNCANQQACVNQDVRSTGELEKAKKLSIALEGARDEPDVLRAIVDLAQRCSKAKVTPNPYR